jgi:hypothetical protein
METNEGTKGAGARARASGYGSIGVAATAMALFAVAIFAGARHARDGSIPGPVPAAPAPATAEVAAAPQAPPAHPPRRLESANRHELETTLPKGAPVEITANDGDPEAFRLAQEIHAFLRDKGYDAAEVTRSLSTPPPKGVGLEPLAGGKWRVIVGSADESDTALKP